MASFRTFLTPRIICFVTENNIFFPFTLSKHKFFHVFRKKLPLDTSPGESNGFTLAIVFFFFPKIHLKISRLAHRGDKKRTLFFAGCV